MTTVVCFVYQRFFFSTLFFHYLLAMPGMSSNFTARSNGGGICLWLILFATSLPPHMRIAQRM